jgi:hypothetical protein
MKKTDKKSSTGSNSPFGTCRDRYKWVPKTKKLGGHWVARCKCGAPQTICGKLEIYPATPDWGDVEINGTLVSSDTIRQLCVSNGPKQLRELLCHESEMRKMK